MIKKCPKSPNYSYVLFKGNNIILIQAFSPLEESTFTQVFVIIFLLSCCMQQP